MPNNNLILRTLISPWITPTPDITKSSVLKHIDVDNNFIYLRGELIYSATTVGNLVTLKKINGNDLSFNVGSGGGNTYWTSGSTGFYSIKTINDSGLDATGNYSVAEGFNTLASGNTSHAEGFNTIAGGDYSHSEGQNTTASGQGSHAEGFNTTASDESAHAEGGGTTASGPVSHAEGDGTTASAIASHAEGGNTTASANFSHAEGRGTTASGTASHSEGVDTIASGDYSHAGGSRSTSSGNESFIHSTNSLVSGARSAVLGGQNITGTTDDTVYVPYLNIGLVSSGTPIVNLALDANNNVITGATGLSSGSCISDLYVTNIHGCSPVTIKDDLIIEGDLTILGSATTVDIKSEEVHIADNFVLLNSNVSGGTPTENSGIDVRRGDQPNGRILWNETDDRWEVGTSGTTYEVITTNNIGLFTGNTLQEVLVNGNVSSGNDIIISDDDILQIGSSDPTWQFSKNSVNGRLEVYNTDEGFITQLFDQEYFHSVGISGEEWSFVGPAGYNDPNFRVRIQSPSSATQNRLLISSAGLSASTFSGLTYLTDYSSNFTNRSLVDKEYVDNSVSGATIWSQSGSNIYYNDGNVGIGVSDPTFSLDIVSSGGTSSFENISRFRTIDSTDYLAITNAVSTDGSFNPVIRSFNDTNTLTNLYIQSVIDPSVDTGANPLIMLQGRVNTEPGVDPWSGVTTRPIIRVRNNTDDLLDITANGNVGIGTITPSEKLEVSGNTKINGTLNIGTLGTGTSVTNLGLDGSGNVVTSSGGASGVLGISNSGGTYTYYSDFASAIAAASAGDTIEMFADIEETTNTTVTLIDGITINGNGHTYTLNVDDTADAFTFTVSNGTVYFNNIKVLRTGRASGTASGAILNHVNNTVKCQGVVFINDYGRGIIGNQGDLHNAHVISVEHGIYAPFSTKNLYNCHIEVSSSSARGTYLSAGNIFNCYVKGPSIAISNGAGKVYNSVGISTNSIGISCNGEVYDSTGQSTSGTGILAQRMTNCVGVSSTSTGIQGEGRNCVGISTSGVGGSGKFYNSTLISSSNYAASGNAGKLIGSTAKSTSSIPVLCGTDYEISNSNVTCDWNNTGGHCTTSSVLLTATLTNNKFKVANASAYCINAYGGGGGSTWNYANNSFEGPTTPITPTLTQGITNTSDSQGNILL